MKVTGDRPNLIRLCIILLTLQLSCAHEPPPSPSEQVRAQLGNIAVVSSDFLPEVEVRTDSGVRESKGTARKYACAAGTGVLIIDLILVPAAALVGCIVGGERGRPYAVPEKEVEKMLELTRNVMAEVDIQKTVSACVLETGMERTGYYFDLIEEQGPTSPEEKLSYAPLSEKGIDTALLISVRSVGFICGAGRDPGTVLFITVHARLVRVNDKKQLYSSEFLYSGKSRKLSAWLDSDPRLLWEEFDDCSSAIAERIVEKLFLA